MANIVAKVNGAWDQLWKQITATGPGGETIHAQVHAIEGGNTDAVKVSGSLTAGGTVDQGAAGTEAWPVKIASGDDVTLGATADAAVETDAVGTVSGKLRGLVKLMVNFLGRFPAALGANGGLKADVLSVSPPTAIYNGIKVVTTATTRVALASTQALKSGVQIKAYTANTGVIYVGNSTVAAANGYRLNAGESVFLAVADLATVNLDASVNGEGVSFIAS